MSSFKALYDSKTLVENLERFNSSIPDKICITISESGKATIYTYGDLWRRAKVAASKLSSITKAGDRVIIAMPTSAEFIDYFFGCLLARRIAVPVPVEKAGSRYSRIEKVLEDCQPTVVVFKSASDRDAMVNGFKGIQVHLVSDLIEADEAEQPILPGQIALVQYTSGSTSDPKGVVLTHENLISNIRMIHQGMQVAEDEKTVSWLPLHHDLGLIGNLLTPICCATSTYLYPYQEFARNPLSWLQAISEQGATASGAPTFAFNLIGKHFDRKLAKHLTLKQVRLLYCGAERISPSAIRRFYEALEETGLKSSSFYTSYGLAEGSLFASGEYMDGRNVKEAQIGSMSYPLCGTPAIGLEMRVLSDEGDVLPEGKIGHVEIRGDSVSKGYWKDIQADLREGVVEGKRTDWLRTGDLGCFHNGSIVITGRTKDVLKIRGKSFFAEDIEVVIERLEEWFAPNSVVATSSTRAGSDDTEGESLTLIVDVIRDRRAGPFEELLIDIQEKAQDLGLRCDRLIVISSGTLPRTSSGKKQRSRTAQMFQNGLLNVIWDSASGATAAVEKNDNVRTIETNFLSIASTINFDLADERRSYPSNLINSLRRAKMLGLLIPANLGGLGVSHSAFARLAKAMGRVDLTLGSMVGNHNTIGVLPILNSQVNASRDLVLHDIATNGSMAAFALTEPGAGSNPRAIKASARRRGDKILLQGEKIWIGNAKIAEYISIFVKEFDESGKDIGVSAFLLRNGNHAYKICEEQLTLGLKAMPQTRITLNDCEVTEADRLSPPGEGLKLAFSAMEYARFALAAMSVGAMEIAIERTDEFANQREIWTGSLGSNHFYLRRMAEQKYKVLGLKALVKESASILDEKGILPPIASLICKILAGEWTFEVTDTALQFTGGRGYTETFGLARIWRDARVLRVFEGPTETLCYQLGSMLVRQVSLITKFLLFEAGSPGHSMSIEVENTIRQRASADVNSESLSILIGAYAANAIGLLLALREQTNKDFIRAIRLQLEIKKQELETNILRSSIEIVPTENTDRQVLGRTKSNVVMYDGWTGIPENDRLAESARVPEVPDSRVNTDSSTLPPSPPVVDFDEQAVQAELLKWVQEFTRTKSSDVNVSIAAFGVDSLLAYELLCFVEDRFLVTLPESIISKRPSIADLSKVILSSPKHGEAK